MIYVKDPGQRRTIIKHNVDNLKNWMETYNCSDSLQRVTYGKSNGMHLLEYMIKQRYIDYK